MMEGSIKSEDTVSLPGNGTMASDGVLKGRMQSIRQSIKKATSKKKESKDSPKPTETNSRLSSPPPSSPSPSVGATPQEKKTLTRSKTDPGMSHLGGTLLRKGASIRKSLNFGSKRDSEKSNSSEPTRPISEALEEKIDEEKEKGIDESYSLPDLPHTPLSVMQINKLIDSEVLEEAYVNLLGLRLEFEEDQKRFAEDSPMELSKKEKDLNLLYQELRNKICSIVRDANSLSGRNKESLIMCSRIIQEEEKRAEQPGGLTDSWMEAWRTAVCEGVQKKVKTVPLDKKEPNTQREVKSSWLAEHLHLLGKVIVEDLKMVKKELRFFYPPSFKVFSTYVQSLHKVVGQHLVEVEKQVVELKDFYHLLDWIVNRYNSEEVMASPTLQPEMMDESSDVELREGFLELLMEKYCSTLKEEMKMMLDRVIKLENEEVWMKKLEPEQEENFLHSKFPIDVWTWVKGKIKTSDSLEAELGHKVICICFKELKTFPKRFDSEFRQSCKSNEALWTEYQISYINSFIELQRHTDEHSERCPQQTEEFKREVRWLIERLLEGLQEQFEKDVEPFLRRMLTRKWLTNDDDFNELCKRVQRLSQLSALMRAPHAQEFIGRLHHHVVKGYVGQLMKNNYTCKNQKHERAAAKMRQQWKKLRDLFEEMNSPHEWLHPAGDDLSNLIGQKNKADIKNQLQPLVQHYPDFSKKHLVAVLYFRGIPRGREHQLILQKLSVLKRKEATAERSKVLFGDMQVEARTGCLAGLPFSCPVFLPVT